MMMMIIYGEIPWTLFKMCKQTTYVLTVTFLVQMVNVIVYDVFVWYTHKY